MSVLRESLRGPETADVDATSFLDDLRTLLIVRRDDRRDVGVRQVYVRIDGGRSIPLCFGESITIELQPGAHRVRVHNTLMWKNVRFTIEAGEHLELLAINEARWWTAGMAGVLGSAPLFLRVLRRSLR